MLTQRGSWFRGLAGRAAPVVAALALAFPALGQSEYQSILNANGPLRWNTTNSVVLMLDEPAGSTLAVDTARTPEQQAAGWGVATNHHATPEGAVFGVTGNGLIAGGLDRCVRLDADDRLIIADPSNDFDFAVGGRFGFGLRFIAEAPPGTGVGEWTLASRLDTGPNPASRQDDRGWRLSLRRDAAGVLRLRMWLIAAMPEEYSWKESVTPILPGIAYSVVVVSRGAFDASSMLLCINGVNGEYTAGNGDAWWSSSRTITGGVLRLGSEAPGVAGFSGWISGFFVQPRSMSVYDAEFLHSAATGGAGEEGLPLHANLAIISEALGGSCFARVVGDSTSTPGDTSVGDLIPRRLSLDNVIPRRIAHYKPFTGLVRYGTPPAVAATSPIWQAPGASWPAVPERRGTVLTVITSARDVGLEEWECGVPDSAADIMDAALFPTVRARVIYPVTSAPTAAPARRITVSNGAGEASGLILPHGADVQYAATDIDLATPASTGSTVLRIIGDDSDETGLQAAAYGAWLLHGDQAVRAGPGLWWAGAVAHEGTTSYDHAADGRLYDMAEIDEFDAALTSGSQAPTSNRIVFVLLTLNDLGVDTPTSIVRDNLAAIAARWTSRGYKVCLVQPWLPYLSIAANNPARLPTADMDAQWRDAFLPLATPGSNIACVSLYRAFRGVPYQFLEGPSQPSYSLHALDSHGALRLLIPLSRALLDAAVPPPPPCPADFNGEGGATVQDIYDFLSAWSIPDPGADFNGENGVTVQDIYDFLTAWTAGCP